MASEPARNPPGLALSVLYVGLGLSGFVGTVKAITPLVPWPNERGMRAKYEHFVEHGDEYDALYLGSSRVLRAVDPKVVDERVEAAGRPFRSFNFALDAMMAYESDFVLRELLALRPARLRWVVIEANPWYGGYDNPGTDPHSERAVHWHTPEQTWKVLRTLRLSDKPLGERLNLAGLHIETAAWKFANYGQGPHVFKKLAGLDGPDIAKDIPLSISADDRGYQRMEGLTTKEHTEGREVFLPVIDKYKEYVARIPEENARGASLATYDFESLRDQVRAVESAGAEPVYLNMPNFVGTPEVIALGATGELPHFLQLNDPLKYPDVFEVDARFDRGHLSRQGAVAFSRHLADGLVEIMAQH